jgi:aspartate carbamoyltransferase catalytic subunit
MPGYVLEQLDPASYRETSDLEEVIGEADILYMSRVQRERFVSELEYERLKNYYILDLEKLAAAKEDMIVMHPLPRVNEICDEVDQDPRAVYFEQARFGMFIRMALILKLLNLEVER